jgi:hypothetical protein
MNTLGRGKFLIYQEKNSTASTFRGLNVDIRHPCLAGGVCESRTVKSPGESPGFARWDVSSGDVAERFGDAGPEGLRGRLRDLLGERGQFLGLLGHRLELLARVCGRQLRELGR